MKLEGALSVKAALLAKRREVTTIFVDKKKKDKDTDFISKKAKENRVNLVFKERDEIDKLCDGKTHGGVMAYVEERKKQNLEEAFQVDNPFICILEGVEDPFNLGYALRTLYSAGCTGVILRRRDWSHVDSTILKSSAGASEYINWIESDNLQQDLKICKQKGCQIFSAMRKDAIPYFDQSYKGPMVLAIGGEMRGLSRQVLDETDQNIYIPYANDFRNALNASSAVAAISFEVVRQRRGGK